MSEVCTASIITLIMATVHTSETSVSFYETAWRCIAESCHLYHFKGSDGFIISSVYCSVAQEHRAPVKVRHLVLFAAKALNSAKLFFYGFSSFSTVRRHVVLGRPLFLVSCGWSASTS
jgi:hypothetical protein